MRAHERARPGTALAELAGGTLLQYRILVLYCAPCQAREAVDWGQWLEGMKRQ